MRSDWNWITITWVTWFGKVRIIIPVWELKMNFSFLYNMGLWLIDCMLFSIYSRIFPSYRDIIIASVGLHNLNIDSRSMTFDQRRLFIVPYLLWHKTWVIKYLQKALSRKIPIRTKVKRVPQKISRRLYEMKLVISYIFWANGVLGYSSLWVVTRTTLCCRFRPLALPFLLSK